MVQNRGRKVKKSSPRSTVGDKLSKVKAGTTRALPERGIERKK